MRFIADLHIHSKYSRATARNLDLENLYLWAQYKGIQIDEIIKTAGEILGEGIKRMRQGKIEFAAGYDGEFGTIKIFDSGEREHIDQQLSLF